MTALAGGSALEGTWGNPDKATGGITKMVISKSGSNYVIQAWGKCSPNDCDWGKANLHLIASCPASTNVSSALATWDQGHAMQYMVLQIEPAHPNAQVLVQTFTVFKDASKRSNFRALYLLQKEVKVEAE
jgi:hypothetical protein